MSASFPLFRVPLFILRIFAGFEVIAEINFLSLTDLLWKSSKAKGRSVSTPEAPVAAWAKVNLLDSSSWGLWSETITSIVPSFIDSTRDFLSFSVLKGGESFKKVLKSPISFSFKDKLLIETPELNIFPSFSIYDIYKNILQEKINLSLL